jgi:hemerythrin
MNRIDSYGKGYEPVKGQNQQLLLLLQQLRNAKEIEDPLAEYRLSCETLRELSDFTRGYFAEEERLMREYGYPQFEDHRQEHVRFLELVLEVEAAMRTGEELTTPNFFCDLVGEWWEKHAQSADQQFAAYLLANANAA